MTNQYECLCSHPCSALTFTQQDWKNETSCDFNFESKSESPYEQDFLENVDLAL